MAGSGKPVQVSPRDNHLVEGAVVVEMLTQTVAPALSQANAPESTLRVAELNLNHLGEHLALGAALGLNKNPAFKEIEKFYAGFKKQLGQVVQIRAEAAVAQSAVAQQVRTEDAAVSAETTPATS